MHINTFIHPEESLYNWYNSLVNNAQSSFFHNGKQKKIHVAPQRIKQIIGKNYGNI